MKLLSGGSSVIRNATFAGYEESVEIVSASGNTSLDISSHNVFDVTLSANSTITFVNPPLAGKMVPVTVILRQNAVGSKTASFTSAIYTDGNEPELSTGAYQIDVLSFFTVDGGATYLGTFAMANVS